jgi:pimeloyl-ACP methyl ester carboxylesterase
LLSSGSSGGELDPTPTTVAGRQALVAYYRSLASACQAASGDELPFVGTVDDARDLDRIRAALGDQQLTYIGHSYGTLLGATYAAMFPAHVRAMVLDGAIDPALPMTQMVVQQAEGFEHALGDFFTWCAATASCPWRPVGDPTTALLALIARVTQAPLPAGGGQTAGPDEVYDGLLAGLGSQGNWPELGAALGQAEAGNGSLLTSSSNRYENGGSSNGAVAELAVDCLDHPVERNPADYPAMAVAAGSAAPVFGPLLTWGLLACAEWPALPTRTVGPASDTGAPPILVVGTTGDPVTPYKWAVALAQQLDHGDLLTWQGESHVASFSSACVRAAEQAYLLNGALPPTGTVCRD